MTNDFYKTLGVAKGATQSEIKTAYKKLVLLHHPDKAGSNQNNHLEAFIKIQEAYQVLSDPIKRSIYDGSSSTTIVISSEWINQVMANMLIIASRPRTIEIDLTVSFKDVYQRRGKRVDIKVKRWIDDRLEIHTETISFSLVNVKSKLFFKGRGDDGNLPNLHPRGDIAINISITDYDDKNVRIDSLFSPLDLFVDCKISLCHFYTLATIPVELCQGVTLDVPNDRILSYCLKGLGLPTGQDQRSDIYITMMIDLPLNLRVDGRKGLLKCLNKYFLT